MSLQPILDRWLSAFQQTHLEWLLIFTIGVILAWLALAIFVTWRRWSTNLTPVDLPSANPAAQPDFLKIDHQKRQAALARGDQYVAEREIEAHGINRLIHKIIWLKRAMGWFAILLTLVDVAIFALSA